ncbi:uncharacterized protein B0P05DRAFT_545682 [Gilbertella persicaria]|uniref:uncharacterized protein n=1 Tax=Gilbertella persicaria TaxID=101096 RepID=UPI00221F8AE3|nr:uncharacterized protein B0P05DRAFT_545682 [Gilbertella persicaria]KAI8076390.1 hypothetical protein B0P05DRAFT_545682 [Gilbertella persicaria]
MSLENNQNPTQTEEKSKAKLEFKSLHFGWFAGHVWVVLNTTVFLLSSLFFHPLSLFYRSAYLGIVVSYGIVIYNSYKPLLTSEESNIKRVLLDENAQYLGIALYFLISSRVSISLLPFFIYSIFHVLTYVDSDLIPNLAPHQSNIQKSIQKIITERFEQAMVLGAQLEVYGVMGRLVLGFFVFRSSILSILLYGQFLRMRYHMSPRARQVLTELGTKVDSMLTPPTAHPKIPPAVLKHYATFKEAMFAKPLPVEDVNDKKSL